MLWKVATMVLAVLGTLASPGAASTCVRRAEVARSLDSCLVSQPRRPRRAVALNQASAAATSSDFAEA